MRSRFPFSMSSRERESIQTLCPISCSFLSRSFIDASRGSYLHGRSCGPFQQSTPEGLHVKASCGDVLRSYVLPSAPNVRSQEGGRNRTTPALLGTYGQNYRSTPKGDHLPLVGKRKRETGARSL